MIKLLLIFTAALAAISTPPRTIHRTMSTVQKKASLTINVSGVSERKGKLQVALFNSAEGFPSEAKPFRTEVLNINDNNPLQVIFKDLPDGEYSVAVYHDKNSNGKLDKNLLGIPVEDYGFSNDTRGTRMSAPSFEDTKMQIGGADAEVAIEVR